MDELCVVVYVPEEAVPPINLSAALAGVMPQLVLSCNVRRKLFGVKLYQDLSMVVNKIVEAELNQI